MKNAVCVRYVTHMLSSRVTDAMQRYISVDNYTCNVVREQNASAESECAIRNYYADSRGVAFPYVISLYGYYYLYIQHCYMVSVTNHTCNNRYRTSGRKWRYVWEKWSVTLVKHPLFLIIYYLKILHFDIKNILKKNRLKSAIEIYLSSLNYY